MGASLLRSAGSPVGGRRGRSLPSRLLQLAAFALSFILVALLVVTSSRAAFVAQNDNTANTVTAASIALGDNDGEAAMFAISGLAPGTVESRCIQVTYTGTINPTEVKLYIAAALPANDLSDYLNLTVDVGAATGQTFPSCTGFTSTATIYTGDLLGFATAHPDYATTPLATTWDPVATGEARTFRFRVSVQDDSAAQGKSTTFGFSWETRTS